MIASYNALSRTSQQRRVASPMRDSKGDGAKTLLTYISKNLSFKIVRPSAKHPTKRGKMSTVAVLRVAALGYTACGENHMQLRNTLGISFERDLRPLHSSLSKSYLIYSFNIERQSRKIIVLWVNKSFVTKHLFE